MKTISIKVSNNEGEVLKEWTKAKFDGFTKEINSGLGECLITLMEKIDYQGPELNLGNGIDIYIADDDTVNLDPRKIYSGYISMIEPRIDGTSENIIVHALGHYTKLSVDYLKNGDQITLYSDSTAGLTVTAPGDEADIGLIARAIIERYRTETENPKIYYNQSSIPLAGQTAWYTVALKTYREALDKIISMYSSNYFYYFDENGLLTIKQKATEPTHIFQLGKHFKSIDIQKSMEKIRNNVIVWNGDNPGVLNNYPDEASIKQYGRRTEYIKDTGIVDDTAADKIGAKFLAENKDEDIKLICEILDGNIDTVNGYDIESVQPGDTCSFIGFNQSLSSILHENMLITKVDYTLEKIVLTIEMRKSGIINWQNKTSKEVNDLSSQGIPDTY
jgi:hypothetical protein